MHGVTEPCPECQFDPASVTDADLAERFRTFAKRYPIPLTRLLASDTEAVLRTRPAADTWCALEYAGHAAQMFELTADGVRRVAATPEDETCVIPAGDVDADVRDAAFADGDPSTIAARVGAAAADAADAIAEATAQTLARAVTFDAYTVPLRLIVVSQLHEGHHHLLDIGRVLRTVRAGG